MIGKLTVVVVVTHLGVVVVVVVMRFPWVVDGLVDDSHVLTEGRRSTGHVDSDVVNYGRGSLVVREAGGVDCLLNTDSLLENGTVGWGVNSCAYAGLLAVAGLETGAVFTLGDVDRGGVAATRLGVVLNVGLRVGRLRSGVKLSAPGPLLKYLAPCARRLTSIKVH